MLRRHLDEHGTTPDGRLFRGTRGGIRSESIYGRAWHTARQATQIGTLRARFHNSGRSHSVR